MSTSLEALRRERQRKLQVRESFSRGLDYFRSHEEDPLEFYLACADYLVTGQRRLVDQDRRLVDLIAPRVPLAQRDDHEAITALRGRLELADRTLEAFEAATAELRRRGTSGRGSFEAAALKFIDILVNVLGARSHSLRHLTTTLLTEDDWRQIVCATEEFADWEAEAFERTGRLAPAGLAPQMMPTEPRAAAARDSAEVRH